jgi:hypothetical protein
MPKCRRLVAIISHPDRATDLSGKFLVLPHAAAYNRNRDVDMESNRRFGPLQEHNAMNPVLRRAVRTSAPINKTRTAILVAFLFFAVPGFSSAARMGPDPLLAQMEQGYGVVAAIVEKATLVPPRKDYPTCFDVRFKVHAVLAQPVTGGARPAKVGSRLELRVCVGYGCIVEMWGGGKICRGRRKALGGREEISADG